MPLKQAVTESDCLSQAKEMGFDDPSSKRICDAIAEDAPNLMDDQYPDTEPDADDYNNSEFPEKKSAASKMMEQCAKMKMKKDDSMSMDDAMQECEDSFNKSGWYNPNQTTTDVQEKDDDTDLQTAADDTNIDGSTGDANYDLSNDGPDFNHLGREVDEAQNTEPDMYDFDGNNSTLENNDHIDTHMDYAQKQEGENLADMDSQMEEGPAEDLSNGITEPKGKLAVSDSITGGPIGASVEVDPFESNGHFFIKAFLLDSSVNLNKWGVSTHTLDANVNSFIGKPLVLTENFDHPDSGDPNLDHALLYQELYRIGTVIDVVKKGSRYDAIAEITDPYAVSAWKEGKIPIYVSPQIYKQDYTEPDSSISKWQGTHLALVKDPAFGVKVADFKGSCTGEADKCLALLKKASIIQQHGYGSCGYCNRKLLLSAKVSHHDKPVQTPKVNVPPGYEPQTEPEAESISSLTSTNANSKTYDLTEAQTKEAPKSNTDSLESAQKKIASLEQKLAIALKANEEKDSVNSDLAKRMAALETEMRRDKVAAILSAAEIKEGFEDRVASLSKSNLPIEEIQSIYKPYLEAKSVKSASVENSNSNKQEPKIQYVESKVSMKNASVESQQPSNEVPAWLATRNYLFKGVSS